MPYFQYIQTENTTMTKQTLTLFTLLLLLTSVGCKKSNPNGLQAFGTIYYSGSLQTDGCDWVIQLADGNNYHPLSLGTDYQISGQKIMLNYNFTPDTFICGWANKLPIIQINTIKKL